MLAPREPLWSQLCEVREVLMFTFDFELLPEPIASEAYTEPSPWLPAFLVPNAQALVVGRDATGGVYVACEFAGSERHCFLHIDTRGHAVPLGENLEQAVALLIALPYWHQLLSESRSGSLEELRALASELEREVCDDLPALPLARADLQRALQLPPLEDPVRRLHELAATNSVQVLSPHGWYYSSPMSPRAAVALS